MCTRKDPRQPTRTLAMAAVTPEDLTALRTQIAQLQESQAELRDEVDVLKSSEDFMQHWRTSRMLRRPSPPASG